MQKVSLLVRKGFGQKARNHLRLSKSEKDRLTSRSGDYKKNLLIEFEIEKEILSYAQKHNVSFCHKKNNDCYDFKTKKIKPAIEIELIKKLNIQSPSRQNVSSDVNFSYPFILKNAMGRKGKQVYLIESESMLVKALDLMIERSDRNNYIFQEFIDTPGDYFTSYRVTISNTGRIFSANLLYSGQKKSDRIKFIDESFPLETLKVVSNRSSGGSTIVLNPIRKSKPISTQDKLVLKQHSLDPINPKLPEYIRKESVKIARFLGQKKLGLIYGIDWIQSKNGKYYYLETNISPGSSFYADKYYNGVGSHEKCMKIILKQVIRDLIK